MNLAAPFIKRPIGTTLLALGLAIGGIVAFNLLPVASLPQIDFPTIRVSAFLPGASPEIMATSVATPLERQLGRIAGVTEMTSASNLGTTRIVVQFDLSRNINGAARDVQAAITAARSQLPANLPSNPIYRKVNPAEAPILIIALTSDIYTRGQMYDVAATVLQQKLSQVEGIGEVTVGGSSLPAVRVELNPTALNKYGIGLNNVSAALAAANVNRAKGQLTNTTTTTEITTTDQLFHAYQYKPLIIAYRNNSPVRISDVAQVNDSVENLRNAGLFNGKPAVMLVLFKQPGANVIATTDRIRAMLPALKASIPGINLTVALDRTLTIRASLLDIEIALLIALILVILVTYVFLGSFRAMIIPGVALVLSLLGTFGAMYLLGYSLNNLSLMALTVATGFVVDDAVVVLENTSRHIELGTSPLPAAIAGASEVGFTVLSMSTSLIAVFIPILLMGGIVGRLLREFAVTLSLAILVSLLVSLTVTPMMCSQLLKSKKQEKPNRYQRIFTRAHNKYASTLSRVLHHRWLMFLVIAMTLLVSISLYVVIPKRFFPQQDTGRIVGAIQADQDISFQAMNQKLTALVDIVKRDPEIATVVGYVGGNIINAGVLYITLKPQNERDTVDAIINRLRGKLGVVPGATLYLQAVQDLVIGGRQSNAQFQYTLTADNLQDLNTWTPRVLAQIAKLPGIADVNSDQRSHGLQEFVTIDHDAAARFGITTQQIDQTLYHAFGQSQVSTMFTQSNQYHVIMEVAPPYWQRPETLNDIYILSPTGNEVPLSAIAHFAPSTTLLAVNHQGLAPAATLSFNVLPEVALDDAIARVGQAVTAMHLPATIRGRFQGTAQAFQASLANQLYLILTAILVVYIVLGILYESTFHPITILSTLPSAGVGALLALLLSGTPLGIMGLIGIILLMGIVKKNAIMMIDFALEQERVQGKSPQDAIYEACLLRFRPILMTTMAALLGALPLVLGFGTGAELRRPLGITIVGGLIVSQILTLYTTPVIYLALESGSRWFHRLPRFFIKKAKI